MSSLGTLEDSSAASVSLTAPDAQDCFTINSSSSSYKVLDFLGEGGFGTIISSVNLRTRKMVALKIMKDTGSARDAEHEAGD
ncbi:unnamed protein product [Pleuronectes platessa]|uniref:Protein kinase domain-containing protein n=1 Tax=Pleuronectes platessa TaxID=8262 RepID=A0A9N7Z5A2_PLEPL|nr:unnamed protein product [Pleuronectes platessa]